MVSTRLSTVLLLLMVAGSTQAQHYCNRSLSPTAHSTGLIYSDVLFPRVFDPHVTHTLETPVQIRAFHYLQLAGWNAWAHYLPRAADIFGRTRFKRPANERMLSNKNVALMFAMYRVYVASPASFGGAVVREPFRAVIREQGFDPDDECDDVTTAVGLGNRMGRDTARLMSLDGWNQNGELTASQELYRLPFQDYTGYRPRNGPYEIGFPFRWQPFGETNRRGFFFHQDFVTPQLDRALSFTLSPGQMDRRRVTEPYRRPNARRGEEDPRDLRVLRGLAREVMDISANLTEDQRLMAEFFDNKVKGFIADGFALVNGQNTFGTFSIAPVFRFELLANYLNFTPDDNMIYGLAANVLAYDATVLAWKEKVRVDLTRPTGQTMRLLFGDRRFSVWGGPGKGPVRIRAGEWQPYIRAMPHAEFPSGSSCLCEALVEHALITTGGENRVPYTVRIPKGSSTFYPGMVPEEDREIVIEKLTDWSRLCGESRLWAGVHFRPSIMAGKKLCNGLGRRAQNLVDDLLEGRPSGMYSRWLSAEERRFFE